MKDPLQHSRAMHLPNEILLMIGKHVDDLPTKRSLTLCSKQFCHLFQPLLYSQLDLTAIYHRRDKTILRKVAIPLIQHICRRPDLASFVRCLKVEADDPTRLDYSLHPDTERVDENANNPTSPASQGEENAEQVDEDVKLDIALLNSVLEEICEKDSERSKWLSQLVALNEEAWSSILFTRLVHVKELSLWYGMPLLFQEILNRISKRNKPFHETSPFPFLRKVEIWRLPSSYADSNLAVPFFSLPTVRIIRILDLSGQDWLDTDDIRFDLSSIANPTHSVTEIFFGGAVSSRVIGKWLAACDKLESFNMQYGYHVQEYTYDAVVENPFHPNELRQSLLRFSKSLEHLVMGFSLRYPIVRETFVENEDDPHDWEDMPFDSLKDFSVLKILAMRHQNLMMLVEDDKDEYLGNLLPSSLEYLVFLEIDKTRFSQLVSNLIQLIREREIHVPQLETIGLDIDLAPHSNDPTDYENNENFLLLETACADNGIGLQLEGYSEDQKNSNEVSF
ncbi:hypothetical protein BO78DRAFT_237607 [Aspergillus sclerotiicarbonarius CBS 121057]|uniref:F-box domain-containing protein n=1 Tax=Aspergillus sclerotiicarbonarius (strain CBS 121057 / IBT 28362) TaxID=1448318 RepID=A0A319EJ15_ASPSB|nr:hypothetical protein BO78DRAFT_237607 [Aspergillus sclerotiicarbonarius CBS 121057]